MKQIRRCFRQIGMVSTLLLAACGTAQPISSVPTTTVTSSLPASGETPIAAAPSATVPGATPLPSFPSNVPTEPNPGGAPPLSSGDIPTFPVPPTPVIPAALLTPVASSPAPDLQFSGERALEFVAGQMQWVPRHTGTPGWQKTGDYIIEQARGAGWQVEEQRFDHNGVSVRNIIAKRGTGPLLILGAHYDTRQYADQDPDPARHTDPVPGANDGASGVAVLLELARHIEPDTLGREVWLAFFDAEDNGGIGDWDWIIGSRYMAQHLPVRPEALILVDMIGDADLQIHYEHNSNAALSESIWTTASELGYNQFIPEPKHSMLDDHTPFLEQNIPAVDLIDFDYPHWHTVADTTDKVSAASLEAVGRTLERWLETRKQP